MAYVEENVNQDASIHSPSDEKVSVIENGNFNDEKQQVVQQDYHSSSEETANEGNDSNKLIDLSLFGC